jgi:hypothetical protein
MVVFGRRVPRLKQIRDAKSTERRELFFLVVAVGPQRTPVMYSRFRAVKTIGRSVELSIQQSVDVTSNV